MASITFISRRVVLPEGTRPAAIVVEEERITAIRDAASPGPGKSVDLGDLAILPGFLDPHVHINEPGRTPWEGFRTATRAAAAGGITTVIDMPLNCLPETTTVAALEAKRAAAAGQCSIDWRAWGGAVGGGVGNPGNQAAPACSSQRPGSQGIKCFLLYPGCDGLGLIDEPRPARGDCR